MPRIQPRPIPRVHNKLRVLPLLLTLVAGTVATSYGADLKPETQLAWQEYVQHENALLSQSASRVSRFLDTDETAEVRNRVHQGEIIIHPANGRPIRNVPNGLIHHWVGLVFIPNRSISHVISVTRSYEHYPEFFNPAVLEARVVDRGTEADQFSMVLRQKVLTIDAALEAQYRTTFHRVDDAHWYATTESTRIQEFLNYGRDDQKAFAPDHGSGFVWRSETVTKFEAVNDGVFVEVEAMVLSRGIPASLRWIVNPVVGKISRSALTTSLRQIRDASSHSDTAEPLVASQFRR